MRKTKMRIKAFLLSAVMLVSTLSVVTGTTKVEAASASDAAAIAASQVGYYEKASNAYLDDFTANRGANNYTKYARDIGVTNGLAWCATFMCWCMKQAGVPSGSYPFSQYVPDLRNWFQARGLFRARGAYTPNAGDYILFGSTGGNHVGMVEKVANGIVYTIEGNSSDSVRRNSYYLTNTYIYGYGIINYSGTSSSSATDTSNPGAPYPIPAGVYSNGSSGDAVRWIQKFENEVMGAGLTIDGAYGAKTASAVKAFQQSNGLTADGIVGSQTTAKMLAVWRAKTAPKPVDIGATVCALILRKDIWKPIRNTGTNVELWGEKGTADYYWLFTRQSDGSYIIKSLYDGNVLDVCGAGGTGSNVFTHSANGGDNQKWYIYGSAGNFRIVPKHAANVCLDVAGAGTADGTNIQVCNSNDSVAQKFALYCCSYSPVKSMSVSQSSSTMYIGEKQTLKYTVSPKNIWTDFVSWSSTNTAVATVDSNGVVTAKATGTTTIKCTSTYDPKCSASVTITVKKKETPVPVPTPTTEEPTTEAPTPASATEEPTTEAPTPASATEEPTTEAPTPIPTTEQPTTEQPKGDTTPIDSDWETDAADSESEDAYMDINTQLPEVGDILEDGLNQCEFEVLSDSIGKAAVAYLEPTDSKAKKVAIPAKVVINGVTYKVTAIAEDAFYNCSALKEIVIGKNVTEIGAGAFQNCKKLKSVTIPKTVKKIGENAFRNCKNLKKITVKSMNIKKIGKNAFKNISKKAQIYVPKSKLKTYKKMFKKAGFK